MIDKPDPPSKVLKFILFPEEVKQRILGYIQWPTDHCRIALVSRSLYHSTIRQLYSTLIIAPDRVEAMLSLLRLVNSDPVLQGYVKTLLFDDTIAWRDPQTEMKLAHGPLAEEWKWLALLPRHPRRQPGYLSADKAYGAVDLLQEVFPKLCNLRRVVVRYLDAQIQECSSLISSGFGDLDIPGNNTLKEFFHFTSFLRTYPPQVPYFRNPFIFRGVTTISLCALYQPDLDSWTKILGAAATTLESLAIMHCPNSASVLGSITFPRLTAFELHQANLGCTSKRNFMSDFFIRHPSLEIIAMVTVIPPGHKGHIITHFKWLREPDILPNLHTLRLKAPLFVCYNPSSEDEVDANPPKPDERFDILETFILDRPKIVDIILFEHCTTDRLESRFAALRERLATTRTMKRNTIMAGRVARAEFNKYVCQQGIARSPSEAWWAYKFFFIGLTIERSGYRPKVRGQGASTEI